MKSAAQWIAIVAAFASPVLTLAQVVAVPCDSCVDEEPVPIQPSKNCELEYLDGGIITIASMYRTTFLCGNEPELCRGSIEEVIGGASWIVSWCPMFEDSVGLRFDPSPPNPARSSFLVLGTNPIPDSILREDPDDRSTEAAISAVLAKSAGDLEAYLSRARRSQ